MLHWKSLYFSPFFLSRCYVTILVAVLYVSAVVLTELRLDINFLLQHFSHHLQSGGTPMGINYSKARVSLAGLKSDSAETTLNCVAHCRQRHRRVSPIGKQWRQEVV